MPELPDLEVFKRYVDSTSLHQIIETVEVRDGRVLGGVSAGELKCGLEGRKFESTRRHGKHLFVELDDGPWLLLHFGMTGGLKYYKDVAEEPTHARVLISFAKGYRLAFDDQRLFGMVDLIGAPDDFIEEHELDPLDLDFPAFRERLEGRRGQIKRYVDESANLRRDRQHLFRRDPLPGPPPSQNGRRATGWRCPP